MAFKFFSKCGGKQLVCVKHGSDMIWLTDLSHCCKQETSGDGKQNETKLVKKLLNLG